MKNKKILIIDDDKGFRLVLEEHFLKNGFTVFLAENGQEGLELAEKEKPDLILADVLMPEMDGIKMAKKIREAKNETIIMFLTNLSDMGHIGEAMQTNLSDYIIKSETKTEEIVKRVKARLQIKN